MIRYFFLSIAVLLLPAVMTAQRFAFVSQRDGNAEIYMVKADGSGLRNLSNNPANDEKPLWSPDGTRLLFVSDRDGDVQPFVMNSDGTGQTRIAVDGSVSAAQWSSDGAKILLMAETRAYFARADGSEVVAVGDIPGWGHAWAPDGSKIAYLTGAPYDPNPVVLDIASGSVLFRFQGSGDDLASDFQWSPDSSQMLIPSNTGPGIVNGGRLVIVNFPSGTSIIVPGGFHTLSSVNVPWALFAKAIWSPDGRRILVQSLESPAPFEPPGVLIVNADGSYRSNLTMSPAALRTDEFDQTSWSPDGSMLLFESARSGNREIYVAKADGSSLVNVSNRASDDHDATWSPDGSRIFFSADSGAVYARYMVRPDGSGLEEITSRFGPGYDFQPFGDFSTDPSPTISDGGVVLANLVPAVNTVSPLSIVSIFGTAFSAGSVFYPNLDAGGKIDTILGGTCVKVGGQRAPIFAMTPNQANVQVPSPLTFGSLGVTVIRNCGQADELRSEAATVTVEEATPAFFLYPPYKADGLIAARFNDGYAAVAPEGAISDAQGPSRPAKPGDIIVLFGTGWGRTEADLSTGERGLGADPLHATANPMVTFGGIPLAAEDVLYVGATPEAAGLYQLAIRVPATALPGDNQVVLTVYGKSTPSGPTVSVAAP